MKGKNMNTELNGLKQEIENVQSLNKQLKVKERAFIRKLIRENYQVSKRGRIYPLETSQDCLKTGALWYSSSRTMFYTSIDKITSLDKNKKLIRIR